MYKQGAVVVLISMVIVGAFMPQSWYADADIQNRMQSMSMAHIFGTDIFGRDIFYNIVRGAYNVALIVSGSVFIGCFVGGGVGLYAPRFSQSVFYIVQGIMDVIFAFPMVLFALVIMARYGGGAMVSIIAMGIFFIPVFYRIMLGAVKPLWIADFVIASALNKKPVWWIGLHHILPNAVPVLRANISVQCGIAILIESGLGYLGLSSASPEPTWGSMILDAQKILFVKPILALPVACVIIGFVLVAFSFHKVPDHAD